MPHRAIKQVDAQLSKIKEKEAEQIEASAETEVSSEFTIRSVMVLREAVIDLYQQTGHSPDAALLSKLQKIKNVHDRLDRIKARRAQLELDAAAGKAVDLETGWD